MGRHWRKPRSDSTPSDRGHHPSRGNWEDAKIYAIVLVAYGVLVILSKVIS